MQTGWKALRSYCLRYRSDRESGSNRCRSETWRGPPSWSHESTFRFGRPYGTGVVVGRYPRIPLRFILGYFRAFPPGTVDRMYCWVPMRNEL